MEDGVAMGSNCVVYITTHNQVPDLTLFVPGGDVQRKKNPVRFYITCNLLTEIDTSQVGG